MVLTATLYPCLTNIHVLLLVAVLFSNFVQGQHCKPKDCIDLQCYRVSTAKDGPHTVYPGTEELSKAQVSCDQTAQSGGWTVFMRRFDGSVNFTARTWDEYKHGFGQHGGDTELWLGNEIVHQMTIDYRSQDYFALRVEVHAFNGKSCGLNATHFYIKSESREYSIRFQHFRGEKHCESPSRNLLLLRNYPFQTYDNNSNKACFSKYQGGWWYRKGNPICTEVYLTGKYYTKPTASDISMHMVGFTGTLSLMSCAMLFKRYKAPPCNNPCLNNGICEYLEASKRSRCVCPETHCGEKCERQKAECEVETPVAGKTVWTTPVIAAAGVAIVSVMAIGAIVGQAVTATVYSDKKASRFATSVAAKIAQKGVMSYIKKDEEEDIEEEENVEGGSSEEPGCDTFYRRITEMFEVKAIDDAALARMTLSELQCLLDSK